MVKEMKQKSLEHCLKMAELTFDTGSLKHQVQLKTSFYYSLHFKCDVWVAPIPEGGDRVIERYMILWARAKIFNLDCSRGSMKPINCVCESF